VPHISFHRTGRATRAAPAIAGIFMLTRKKNGKENKGLDERVSGGYRNPAATRRRTGISYDACDSEVRKRT